jgi:hypothetical protein
MDAYLVPVLAAVAAGTLVAAVLGAVRLGRWWAALTGRASRDEAPAAGPGILGDAADPHLSRLAHRALGAALLIGVIALFAFVPSVAGGRALSPAAGTAVLVVWLVARGRR